MLRTIEDLDSAAQAAALQLESLPGLLSQVAESLRKLSLSGRALPYPDRVEPVGILLTERKNAPQVFTDDDDSSSLTREVPLEMHCQGVSSLAGHFSTRLDLPPAIAKDLEKSGAYHDIGKADLRFQAWLRGGNRAAARLAEWLLAKSALPAQDRAAREQARRQANYPKGTRHECYSAAMLQANADLVADATDPELVTYLVGTHHGRGRPFHPAVNDPGMTAHLNCNGKDCSWAGKHGLEHLRSGWTDLFWRLTERYGFWGMAWLETILRLSDHRQSEMEMET